MKYSRPDYNRIQDPENKIPADEPVFLLRGQDKTAAATLRYWAALNLSLFKHDPYAVQLAFAHADLMDAWQVKKLADI